AQEATKDSGWVPVFFENHDLPRCVNYFFPKGTDTDLAAKFIGTILLTMRGTPFIYQAQELGMTNIKWPSIKMYNDVSS
ncbi:glucohydrolase, partial [Fusobacterium mortiferum]|nr:glucohydrolase [Fusobacterium mortiferum]